jgi:hypothetical protein
MVAYLILFNKAHQLFSLTKDLYIIAIIIIVLTLRVTNNDNSEFQLAAVRSFRHYDIITERKCH